MLPAKVRQYFADIGRRGGTAGRRELTRQQTRLMVAICEARRVAKKEGKPPPKLSRQHRAISRTASVTARGLRSQPLSIAPRRHLKI
jgi:hypothetical protein